MKNIKLNLFLNFEFVSNFMENHVSCSEHKVMKKEKNVYAFAILFCVSTLRNLAFMCLLAPF